MRLFPAFLIGLCACGPDPELLERVVRLETEMEEVRTKLDQRTAAPAICAQAKKAALDEWKDVWAEADRQVREARKRESKLSEIEWDNDERKSRHQEWQERRNAATAAKRAANGGAIKAKAAADFAATLHIDDGFDTTEAMAASTKSWEACKNIDP